MTNMFVMAKIFLMTDLVYRSLFPRVFKRDGTGKKKKTCYFFATADVNSTQDPNSLLAGKKAHFKIEYRDQK